MDERTRESLLLAVSSLPFRERLIIEARYFRETRLTLEELGECLKVSRQRVYQLERSALLRLRRDGWVRRHILDREEE